MLPWAVGDRGREDTKYTGLLDGRAKKEPSALSEPWRRLWGSPQSQGSSNEPRHPYMRLFMLWLRLLLLFTHFVVKSGE